MAVIIIIYSIPTITAPEVPLIPCLSGANGAQHWPLRQCRRPDSALLLELQLGPSDLEKIGLAIPTDEFLRWVVGWFKLQCPSQCRQLPPESEFNLPDFDAKDLIGRMAHLFLLVGGSSAYKAYISSVVCKYINTWSILFLHLLAGD